MSAKTKIAGTGLDVARAVPARGSAKLGGKSAKGAADTLRAMPGKRKAAAGAGKGSVKAGRRAAESNAYLNALMHDAALHGQLEDAYTALVKAYDRIGSQDDLANALLEDRRTRRHLSRATSSLRDAAETLRRAKARKRRRLGGRTVLLVALAGGVVALAVNEDLRSKLLGLVSGEGSGSDQTQRSNGVVPAAAVENAPPTTASA